MDGLIQQITTNYAIHIPEGWIEWVLFLGWMILLAVLIYHFYQKEGVQEKNPANWVFYILLSIICSSLFSVRAFPFTIQFFPTSLPESSDFSMMIFQAMPWIAAAVFGKPILSMALALTSSIVFAGFYGHSIFTILLLTSIGFLFNVMLRSKNKLFASYQQHPIILVGLVIVMAVPLFYVEQFASTNGGLALRLDASLHSGWLCYLSRISELLFAGIMGEVLVQRKTPQKDRLSGIQPVRMEGNQKKTLHLISLFYLLIVILTGFWNISRATTLNSYREDMYANLDHINLSLTSPFTSSAIRIDQLPKATLLNGTSGELNAAVKPLFQPVQNVDEFYLFDNHGSLVYAFPAVHEEEMSISDQEILVYQDVLQEETIQGSFSQTEQSGVMMSILFPITDTKASLQRIVLARMDLSQNPAFTALSTLLSRYEENGMHLKFVNTHLDLQIPWSETVAGETEPYKTAATAYIPMNLDGWGMQLELEENVFLSEYFDQIYPFFLVTLAGIIAVGGFYYQRWARLEEALIHLTNRFSASSSADGTMTRLRSYPDSVADFLEVLKNVFKKLELRHNKTETYLNLWNCYDSSEEFRKGIEEALTFFAGPECISVNLFIENRIGGEPPQFFSSSEVENIADYAYLNEQVLSLAKEQDQLVVGNTSRFHQLNRALGKPFPQAFILKKIPMDTTRNAILFVTYRTAQDFSQDFMDDFLEEANDFSRYLMEIDRLQQSLLEKTILSRLFDDLNFPLFIFINKILLYGNKAANEYLLLDEAEEHTSIEKRVQQNEIYNIMLQKYSQEHTVLTRETRDGSKFEIDILNEEHSEIGKITIMLLKDITREKKREEITRDFVTMLSHDLRAPITILQGYSKMMPMVGELNETQQDYLEKIKGGLETIANLVEGILLEDRIENGIQIKAEEIALNEMLQEIKTQLESLANQKRVEIKINGIPQELTVKGDPVLLQQAFYNVISNAVKYTEMDSTVNISGEEKEGAVQIEIQDNGPGIASIDLPLIFEKYYHPKGNGNLSDKQGGMGLYISRFIIEAHQGTISVDSQLGKGTTFTLNLPTTNPIK